MPLVTLGNILTAVGTNKWFRVYESMLRVPWADAAKPVTELHTCMHIRVPTHTLYSYQP